MIKAVIFDLDGTLTNTLETIAHYANTALATIGLAPIDSAYYRRIIGKGRDNLVHQFLSYYNADTPQNYETVGAYYDSIYAKDTNYKTAPYDGICDALTALKENGFKIAVLSNKPHEVTEQIVKHFFSGKFDEFFGKRADFPTKPAPDGAWDVARRLGVAPEECAFVGDLSIDVQTARNANMLSIGVTWGFRGADDVQNADILVNHPSEILTKIKIENEKTGAF